MNSQLKAATEDASDSYVLIHYNAGQILLQRGKTYEKPIFISQNESPRSH